jgi:hypothetical protein
MQKLFFSAAALAILAASAPAFAVSGAPVAVGGNVTTTVTVTGAMTNLAVGNDNVQRNSVCTTYEGTTVRGSLTQTCTVRGAMTNLAVGDDNHQDNHVGSLGAPK